jgi:hypothetical protein
VASRQGLLSDPSWSIKPRHPSSSRFGHGFRRCLVEFRWEVSWLGETLTIVWLGSSSWQTKSITDETVFGLRPA